MKINKTIKFPIIALFILFSFNGCNAKNIEDESAVKTQIFQSGQPGIIGAVDIQNISNAKFPEINLIQITNKKDKHVIAQAVATRLRDEINKNDFILTAAHVFKNNKIGSDTSNLSMYVGSNGLFEGGKWYDFPQVMMKTLNLSNRDIAYNPCQI